MDVAIANDGTGWDVVLVDGDVVMHTEDSPEDIAQRVVYRLMTWSGESPYDKAAGVPYLDGVFGFEPVPGVVALLVDVMAKTEGVDEVIDPLFTLDNDTLTITATLRIGVDEIPLNLLIAA